MAKKKPLLDSPRFGIWLAGRRLGGSWPMEEALFLLAACCRRWERENAGDALESGAVRAADGALHLCAPIVLRRDDGRPLSEVDWGLAQRVLRVMRERPWGWCGGLNGRGPSPARRAEKQVAGWSFGVEWRANPPKARTSPAVEREMFG